MKTHMHIMLYIYADKFMHIALTCSNMRNAIYIRTSIMKIYIAKIVFSIVFSYIYFKSMFSFLLLSMKIKKAI